VLVASDELIPYPSNSQRGLAARWVSWLASCGPMRNPLADPTGRHAGRHQPADVFFLAGAFRDGIHRQVTVPAGAALFVPVIAKWAPAQAGLPVLALADGSAKLDDEPLEIMTIATPTPFTVKGALGNPITLRRDAVQLRCWGLFAQTAPLAAGPHELVVDATDGASLKLAARYTVTAKS
jgi:hypothetical protein